MIDPRRLVKHTFVKGMDTISAETALPRGERGEYLTAREIVNADVDRNGVIARRLGPNADTKLTLDNAHSLWSEGSRLFGVGGGALLEFDHAVSPPEVKNTLASVNPDALMSYAEAAGIVFYGNGAEHGRILADGSVAPIWVPTPDYVPQVVVSSGGSLPAGYYHLAFTWVEDDTRLESGAPEPMSVYVAHSAGDVTAPTSNTSLPTQAIVLTGLPQRQGCKLNVYCSVSGGEAMHRQATIPHGTTSHTITKVSLAGKKLEHLLLADEMPAGAILEAHKGRLLSAVGKGLYFSLPGSYGLTRLDENYLQFAADLNLVAATEDGFYVGADRTYWVSGLAQGTPVVETVHASKPVPGTRCRIPAHLVGLNDAAVPKVGTVPYWFSSAGPMIGLPGGKVLPLTEDSIAHRVYGSGASGFRAINGVASVVTSVRNPGAENRMGVGDSVEVEIRRPQHRT